MKALSNAGVDFMLACKAAPEFDRQESIRDIAVSVRYLDVVFFHLPPQGAFVDV